MKTRRFDFLDGIIAALMAAWVAVVIVGLMRAWMVAV